jgi:hypothetical protein
MLWICSKAFLLGLLSNELGNHIGEVLGFFPTIHGNLHIWTEHKYHLMNDNVPYHFVLLGSTNVDLAAPNEPMIDSMTPISDHNDDNDSGSPN